MNAAGTHSTCQERDLCHGPGCRKHTGKTKRKQNWSRPKPNQHEAEATSTTPTKKGKR